MHLVTKVEFPPHEKDGILIVANLNCWGIDCKECPLHYESSDISFCIKDHIRKALNDGKI